MARIDKFGGSQQPSSDELHEKNERAKIGHEQRSIAKDGAQAPAAQQHKKVLAPGDAERLVSQAGYARSKKKRPGDLDLGDNSQAPIPLPDDDVDASMWSAEALSEVQQQLTAQAAVLRQVREEGETGGMEGSFNLWNAILDGAVKNEGEDEHADGASLLRLQALSSNPPPDALAMQAMAAQTEAHFGVDLAGLDTGAQLLAASLLVAGQKEQVQVAPPTASKHAEKQLDAPKLTKGVESVLAGGRAAVDDGRRMNEGIHKNLAMQRTFVAKR